MITPEYARIVDGFFDVYGYAIKQVKKPNIFAAKSGETFNLNGVRRYWNYIKTSRCNLVASVPSNVANTLINIYDRGITFWTYRTGDAGFNVGDYTRDNGVTHSA